ncbi:DivIVA domain-containing protein [Microlunatus soli]|uniref:DivIVA domain-containing protein n=1 Tax=Microlunatus soli TaxID=630515 RepID=UPI0018D3951D|nr:DivIVA domain-containing protein [Microlunatus soli]
MEWAIAVLVVAVLGVAAAVAAGGGGEMSKDPVQDAYRQDLPEAALNAEDIRHLRFGVTVRGYAMDQVDEVLARLGTEIAERDELIARLSDDSRSGFVAATPRSAIPGAETSRPDTPAEGTIRTGDDSSVSVDAGEVAR